MSGTTIPDALDALVALWSTAFSATDLQVLDGGPAIDPKLDYLCVGYSGIEEQEAVEASSTVGDAELRSDREAYDVASFLQAWTGSSSLSVNRRAALGYMGTARTALAADPKLGGVVMRARFSDYRLIQDVSQLGMAVAVHFTVHVEAFA